MEPPIKTEDIDDQSKSQNTFKKPSVLIGKVGKFPRKTVVTKNLTTNEDKREEEKKTEDNVDQVSSKSGENNENFKNIDYQKPAKEKLHLLPKVASATFSYVEPEWSGKPIAAKDYKLEVLKSGVIIENINLMSKSYWVFGRLESCDIPMQHPTISRYHLVIQYKCKHSDDMPCGFYIYDLGSTHGTFLNKSRIKPRVFARIQVGHMLKLGCSTRTFLLTGPEEDTELESDLSITQLKQLRIEELRQREEKEKEELERIEREREKKEKAEMERGIDWGLGEDADEETDLTVNPYAETNNEQLYIDDPKKALRGFFEREALELQYDCTERGVGQFLCTVELPVDDARGKPIVAEALVKGKKKEAVIQCALEACRILDRHGLLRQATHESRKRKAKNWEENDFYDSDEDTFLDRTGTIEKKREKRMRAKQPQQPETYQSLVAKEQNISHQIKNLEEQLTKLSKKTTRNSEETEADSLDSFMKELNEVKPDKYTIGKLKNELTQLKKEHGEVVKLVNLTRPADLPPLLTQTHIEQPTTSAPKTLQNQKSLPMFGKRLKVKVMLPWREIPSTVTSTQEEDNDEEYEDNEKIYRKQQDDIRSRLTGSEDSQQNELNTQVSERLGLEESINIENSQQEIHEHTSDKLQAAESEIPSCSSTRTDILKPETSSCSSTRINLEPTCPVIHTDDEEPSTSNTEASDDRKHMLENLEMKMLQCDSKALESLDNKVKAKISKTVIKLRKIAEEEESIVVDEKRLAIQKRKILEQVNRPDEKDMDKRMKQLSRITSEFYTIGDRKIKMVHKINKLAEDINKIAVEIRTASKIQHDQAINRMKGFVEKAHKQQIEIYNELEKLEKSTTNQQVIDKLRTLHGWLSDQKSTMLENLEKLKTTKVSENSKLIEEIMKFEEKADCFVTTILEEISRIQEENKQEEDNTPSSSKRSNEDDTESDRKKKRNLRRTMQRQEKAEEEKRRQYEEDAKKEDYNMWVPPENQTGDGRTALNDKYGY